MFCGFICTVSALVFDLSRNWPRTPRGWKYPSKPATIAPDDWLSNDAGCFQMTQHSHPIAVTLFTMIKQWHDSTLVWDKMCIRLHNAELDAFLHSCHAGLERFKWLCLFLINDTLNKRKQAQCLKTESESAEEFLSNQLVWDSIIHMKRNLTKLTLFDVLHKIGIIKLSQCWLIVCQLRLSSPSPRLPLSVKWNSNWLCNDSGGQTSLY